MEELIKLRTFCEQEKEKAYRSGYRCDPCLLTRPLTIRCRGRFAAFSAVIEQLNLILNNSCVKPLDSRSPEGQGCQAGVSRPNDSQNPNSETPD